MKRMQGMDPSKIDPNNPKHKELLKILNDI